MQLGAHLLSGIGSVTNSHRTDEVSLVELWSVSFIVVLTSADIFVSRDETQQKAPTS